MFCIALGAAIKNSDFYSVQAARRTPALDVGSICNKMKYTIRVVFSH